MREHKTTPLNSSDNLQVKNKNLGEITPNFEFQKCNVSSTDIKEEAEKYLVCLKATPHKKILSLLLDQVEKVDFRNQAGISENNDTLKKKHYLVSAIENVLALAKKNNWGICRSNNFIYLYNGEFWNLIHSEELQTFLGEAAEKMGVDKFEARVYFFREQLYKQFIATAFLPKPERKKDVILINLKNGTFEIRPERQFLRPAVREDFITYQLPFDYDKNATAPKFKEFLSKVLPDIDSQKVLAEYLGYIFLNSSTLKLEKTLLLYGSGANGKSVIFEIVNALFGKENVSNYSLKSLTKYDSYESVDSGDVDPPFRDDDPPAKQAITVRAI